MGSKQPRITASFPKWGVCRGLESLQSHYAGQMSPPQHGRGLRYKSGSLLSFPGWRSCLRLVERERQGLLGEGCPEQGGTDLPLERVLDALLKEESAGQLNLLYY